MVESIPRWIGIEVRHERDRNLPACRERKLLFDFAQMAVLGHAVRIHVVAYFAEEQAQLHLAARARHAGERRNDDRLRARSIPRAGMAPAAK